MIYLELFWGFLKVGCFSFGGAYSAIPLIRDVVLSNGWMEEEALSYMIAVSEATPGPIMVNLATYAGSSQAGFPGAMIATLAVVLPSFFVILLLMILLRRVLKNPLTKAILSGLKPCMMGIIFAVGLSMILRSCLGDFQDIGEIKPDKTATILTLLLSVFYFASRKWMKRGISAIQLIALSAVLGIVAYG